MKKLTATIPLILYCLATVVRGADPHSAGASDGSDVPTFLRARKPIPEALLDTVVPYTSSHQDAAFSEKLVDATHTTIYDRPKTIAEVKRILHLHLQASGR